MLLLSMLLAGSALLPQAQGPAARVAPSLHAPFSALLRDHVRNDLVDYDAFAKSQEFEPYLRSLDGARPETMSKPDRLAFWLNVYNAYTIQLINTH
ncbi:MAG: DUF547 domain-containing protein, partial [Vicinamibacteria bacterium]